jgi:hypothetical protein
VAAANAELVAAVDKEVKSRDLRRQKVGLWYGSTCTSVRNLIRRVRSEHLALEQVVNADRLGYSTYAAPRPTTPGPHE